MLFHIHLFKNIFFNINMLKLLKNKKNINFIYFKIKNTFKYTTHQKIKVSTVHKHSFEKLLTIFLINN